MFRMLIALNQIDIELFFLYISIFDITTGEFWYNFLGGSLSVFPKSYVKHPSFEGFHLLKISRNAIIAVMGNLIRKYNFVFKKK